MDRHNRSRDPHQCRRSHACDDTFDPRRRSHPLRRQFGRPTARWPWASSARAVSLRMRNDRNCRGSAWLADFPDSSRIPPAAPSRKPPAESAPPPAKSPSPTGASRPLYGRGKRPRRAASVRAVPGRKARSQGSEESSEMQGSEHTQPQGRREGGAPVGSVRWPLRKLHKNSTPRGDKERLSSRPCRGEGRWPAEPPRQEQTASGLPAVLGPRASPSEPEGQARDRGQGREARGREILLREA